jgi:reactive chlorine resistance protein C
MGWMYRFLSIEGFSALLGIVEVGIAVMIGLRSWSARVAALGSAMAVVMFLTTLSFLFSTPGWEPSLGGFPGLFGRWARRWAPRELDPTPMSHRQSVGG